MKLVKCPRCELNYIYENEKICSVCKRDVKGETEPDDMIELCSECGEHPVIPGQEICVYCLKEMQHRSNVSASDDSGSIVPEEPNLGIESVSTMDEITIDLPDGDDTPFDAGDEPFDDDEDDDDVEEDEDEDEE